jgi:hypothetical protein
MSHGAWVKWAGKNETPTTTDMCPDCRGEGWTVAVEVAPGQWNHDRCRRCDGTGEIGAVIVKGERMQLEFVKVTYELDRNDFFKLQERSGEERNVSKESIKAAVKAAALEAVEDQIHLTDLDLRIAARLGITRDELLESKAQALLDPDELRMLRTMSAVEVLASRIVR